MELLRLKCPVCHSADIQYHSPYTTKNHGGRVIYKCDTCPVYFSETKNTLLEGLKTPVSVIWHVVKARTEGMGLNATARTFDKAKNTILAVYDVTMESLFRPPPHEQFLKGQTVI